jgi:hypothetical protein
MTGRFKQIIADNDLVYRVTVIGLGLLSSVLTLTLFFSSVGR